MFLSSNHNVDSNQNITSDHSSAEDGLVNCSVSPLVKSCSSSSSLPSPSSISSSSSSSTSSSPGVFATPHGISDILSRPSSLTISFASSTPPMVTTTTKTLIKNLPTFSSSLQPHPTPPLLSSQNQSTATVDASATLGSTFAGALPRFSIGNTGDVYFPTSNGLHKFANSLYWNSMVQNQALWKDKLVGTGHPSEALNVLEDVDAIKSEGNGEKMRGRGRGRCGNSTNHDPSVESNGRSSSVSDGVLSISHHSNHHQRGSSVEHSSRVPDSNQGLQTHLEPFLIT